MQFLQISATVSQYFYDYFNVEYIVTHLNMYSTYTIDDYNKNNNNSRNNSLY